MKKYQNYLSKPSQLKKKLEEPSFKHDFVQWSKSKIGSNQNRQSRSKSPQYNLKRDQHHEQIRHSKNKENVPMNSSNKNHSLSKKNFNVSKQCLEYAKYKEESETIRGHKQRYQNKSQPNFRSLSQLSHNKSMNQEFNDHRQRQNYMSLNKSRDDSLQKSKKRSNKKIQQAHSLLIKKSPVTMNKKLEFKYSYRTKEGVLASNPNKTNQDRLLIRNKITTNPERNLFVVADGHGTYGHLASEMIVSNYGRLAEKQFIERNVEEGLPRIYDQLQKILTNSEVNVSCSGSTLVSVVIDETHITCANVGDSRAILARQVDRKSWEMIYLSQDQKPSIQSQKRRILKHGGRVHCLKDDRGEPVGPMRVWLPNQNIQGLAMSRSLGDNVSKPYGVTHKPEIIKIALDKRDKFILLASDGVWEFLSNQQVLQLIVPFYREKKLEQACNALLKLSYERWTSGGDTSVVDDITFILIFLENN